MADDTSSLSEEAHYAFALTQSEVERFRDVMRRESGTELTMAEAWARAIELLALFRMLLGPLPEDPSLTKFEHRSH